VSTITVATDAQLTKTPHPTDKSAPRQPCSSAVARPGGGMALDGVLKFCAGAVDLTQQPPQQPQQQQ
jgi:hypothetical protein